MSKVVLSENAIQILSQNKYVRSVSKKSITYTDEFKIHFIEQCHHGKSARQVFDKAGLDIELLVGIKRVENASYKWRKKNKRKGITGLKDIRKKHRGNC